TAGNQPGVWIKDCFFRLGRASAGDTIVITFPLSRYRTTEHAVGQQFEVQWQGDDVIHISPEGSYHPLYNHRKIHDKAPMREGDYRRPDTELVW
ncbi:hypothetical protein K0U00_44840, partial [Paenibacillus sepulcri]|nr:hypothetical protein [Paenibacillus sepulcri]